MPTITGTVGNNTLYGTRYADTINALAGNDKVYANNGGDVVNGGLGNDSLYGEAGHDTLSGEAGTDNLFGGMGNDIIFGGDDNDQLRGGPGQELLYGGAGEDTFVFDDLDAGYATQTLDVIYDFSAGDKIDITRVDAWNWAGYGNADPRDGEWSIYYGTYPQAESYVIWDTFGQQHAVAIEDATVSYTDVIWV